LGKLTALKVKSVGAGRHADGDGLYLLVKESGARSWMLRVQVDGRRRDIGLGSASMLGLADARGKAAELRKLAKTGVDPVAERKKKPIQIPTFEQATKDCHSELKKGWKNQRHIDSWLASMVNHIIPAIGDEPVDTITSVMVRDAIAPIWMEMPETAQRILQRIGVVLDFAHIEGWRPQETSLRSVRKGLPRQPVVDNHFEAMPYQDVPRYVAKLASATNTVGRDALRFTILTAVRSIETRLAVWPEIDRRKGVWSIPAERMKMNQPHVVPLTTEALEILERRWEARESDEGLVFSSSPKKPISDMTMTKVLREDNIKGYTVHGFRSSFTDWAAEETDHAKEIVDKALAHKLPDRVAAAYRRTDYFEKRKKLMTDWAAYLTGRATVLADRAPA
jgi:integrase